MSAPEQFIPRPSDPTLVISSESPVSITDLKHTLRSLLATYYGSGPSLMMTHSLNFNIFYNRDRKQQAIVISSDCSVIANAVLLDIYARLFNQNNEIKVRGQRCTVALHGATDINQLQLLVRHYFWLNGAFHTKLSIGSERFKMN